MKKYLIIIIAVCTIIFSSCNAQEKNYNKSIGVNDTITRSVKGTSNIDRLTKFVDNVDKNIKDRINLVVYTTEGDPITTQLYFNNKDIEISMDISKDKFAGQDKHKIIYDTIKGGNNLKDDLNKYLMDNNFKVQN